MSKRKMINLDSLRATNNWEIQSSSSLSPGVELKKPKTLSISFSLFDRTHDLFNLGSSNGGDAVSGTWFISLMDCLKDICTKTLQELKVSSYKMHPVDWSNANAKPPFGDEQQEYWQFRINKSKGRVIGMIADNVFYVIWLDPYHNLVDSEGYGKASYYKPGLSDYELKCIECDELRKKLDA